MNKFELKLDAIVIFTIVIINALLGFFQHWKADNILKSLSKIIVTESKVYRDGELTKINAEELVPGDVIYIEEGDKVPADARLIETHNLEVDESILTGESVPRKKDTSILKKDVVLADRKNMIYMNTFVIRGNAKAIVVATGMNTEIGVILKTTDSQKDEKTNFEKEFDSMSKTISLVAVLLISIVVFSLTLLHHSPWLEVFLMAISLAVGAIPEALPAVVTFGFSLGSQRMSKKKFLIKQLPIIEEIGAVDVICTDKTGTLTENHMRVKEVFINNTNYDVSKVIDKNIYNNSKLFFAALNLCNTIKKTDKGLIGDPTEIALVELAHKVNIKNLNEKYPTVDMIPFDSKLKRMTTVHSLKREGYVAFTKGAPEILIMNANEEMINGEKRKLTIKRKKELMKIALKYEKLGYRVLSVGYHHLDKPLKKFSWDGFVLLGIVGMRDPPRKEVKEAILKTQSAGMAVKMITGDTMITAQAIAKEIGMGTKAISWDKLKDLDEISFKEAVKNYDIFARIDPLDKYKIVRALQHLGKRVAITGDGVNDVAAIKRADVGIAMGIRGTDITKEVADAILLDDNFSTIVDGIIEGRTIFHNVRKVVNYLLTANFAEVIMVFLASLFGFIPIQPLQLLWVNLVTDIFPALSLSIDPPPKNIMKEKPKGKSEKILNSRISWMVTAIGLKKAIIALLLFIFVFKWKGELYAQTVTFTWMVLSHFVRIAAIRFEEGIKLFVNKWLNYSLAIPLILQVIILYTPIKKLLHSVSIDLHMWVILTIVVFVAIWLAITITKIIMIFTPNQDEIMQ